MSQVQTKENHTRYHPLFHFFFVPAIGVLVAISVYELLHSPGLVSATQVLMMAALAVAGFLARINAVKVQSRVIRLEERLRLARLAPPHLLGTLQALTEGQLIALRFASDEELPELAVRAQRENLEPNAIRAAITKWRPDDWRV